MTKSQAPIGHWSLRFDWSLGLSHFVARKSMFLAGDIGGTNSRLAIFDSNFSKVHESVTKNAGRSSFTEIVKEFLKSAPQDAVKQIKKGCCGVAGPVANGKVTLTNLSWQLDETTLAKDLGL